MKRYAKCDKNGKPYIETQQILIRNIIPQPVMCHLCKTSEQLLHVIYFSVISPQKPRYMAICCFYLSYGIFDENTEI